jgi:drug/metabolite transporter (DMT)-like permease
MTKGGNRMGWKKASGILLLVLGVVLLILSLAADLIGIGAASGFGYKQIIGVVLGVIAGIRGFMILKR